MTASELMPFVWAIIIALIAIGMRRHIKNKQDES